MNKLAYKCCTGLWCILAITMAQIGAAQVAGTPSSPGDSTKIIHLLNADELMGIQPGGKDSSQLQKLIGNVRLVQGQTIFTCDSALQNLTFNTIEAYGHIHINQADTINTYSDFLHYEGNTKVATLKKNVRMTDGQMVLTSNLLDYDMNTHVGSYLNGGKIVTGSTVLVSQRGYYFADTKDVYFKNEVQLTDPEYTLVTDTLLYNTNTRIAHFVAPTTINTGSSVIHTTCGYYNTLEHYAHLCNRSTVIDSSQQLTADSLNFNRNTGIGIALGNVVWTDTAQQMTVLANYAISDQQKNTILATQKPLMILQRKTDTLFLAADTLFSGPLTVQKDSGNLNPGQDHPPTIDSTTFKPVIPARDSLKVTDTAASHGNDTLSVTSDRIPPKIPDSLGATTAKQLPDLQPDHTDSSLLLPDSARRADTPDVNNTPSPAARLSNQPEDRKMKESSVKDTATVLQASPNKAMAKDSPGGKGDTTQLRYVMAFHHVRLYSDSLQGVSDSLYYSDVDSAFHFYKDPILWTGNSQLTGDTIVLTTRNQQADRILLQQHAMIINQSGPGLFNQIKGTNIIGYFSDNNQLDWMEVDGNAESMYYAQDDNGAYVGANRSTSAKIHMYFKDGRLNKVVLLKDVDGNFLPPTKVPEEDEKLRGFKWIEDRRPKSKAELMQ